jgi:TPR repeat protein
MKISSVVSFCACLTVCGHFLAASPVHAQSSLPKNTQLKIDAEKGDPKAQYELGNAYSSSDPDQAFSLYKKSADQGYADGQFAYAEMMKNGYISRASGRHERVNADAPKAAQFYHKAAIQGHCRAQFALGECFHNGWGVKADLASAYIWYAITSKNRGDFSSPILAKSRMEGIALKLTPEEIKQAQIKADGFKPVTAKEPSPSGKGSQPQPEPSK